MNPSHSPMFIVGAPRSGNTLTRRVLMASGQIYIPPETYVFGEILTRWPKWRGLSWTERVWMACAYFDRHEHFEDFQIASFSPLAEAVSGFEKPDQTLKHFFDALYAFMAREHGFSAQRWGDKTPWNTTYLKAIVKAYPDAYFLYLQRDGRDVVASQIKAGMRDIDLAARRWVEANEACRKYLKRAKRAPMSVRYEDLVRDPETVFGDIFAWAELDYSPDYLSLVPQGLGDVERHAHHQAVTRPITDSSIGRWRESLTQNDFSALPAGFPDMMRDLGYE